MRIHDSGHDSGHCNYSHRNHRPITTLDDAIDLRHSFLRHSFGDKSSNCTVNQSPVWRPALASAGLCLGFMRRQSGHSGTRESRAHSLSQQTPGVSEGRWRGFRVHVHHGQLHSSSLRHDHLQSATSSSFYRLEAHRKEPQS